MRLGAIGLPEGACAIIAKLLDSIAGFGGAEGPDSIIADFPALSIIGGRG